MELIEESVIENICQDCLMETNVEELKKYVNADLSTLPELISLYYNDFYTLKLIRYKGSNVIGQNKYTVSFVVHEDYETLEAQTNILNYPLTEDGMKQAKIKLMDCMSKVQRAERKRALKELERLLSYE
jgi:hypothetical protein